MTQKGVVVLVVEDEVMVRDFICIVLEAQSYIVLQAGDGLEALEVVNKYPEKIDLVVTDINMPKMDGIALIDQLSEQKPETKVLAITGKESDRLAKVLERGVPLLKKPFVMGPLLEKIGEILSQK